MRILEIAAEAAPYSKVGGLGDVAGALPRALRALGHDVRLVVPRASGVMPRPGTRVAWCDRLAWGGRDADVCVLASRGRDPVPVRLVDSPALAAAPVYGGADDADRHVLLADAALEDCARDGWLPDVVHAHDWHAAPAVLRVTAARGRGEELGGARTVLTVHNMAYQGRRDASFASRHGLDPPGQDGDGTDEVNLLGRALACADRVTAVSPTFAWEIGTPEGGFGLDGVLRGRGESVVGIVNGIDTAAFDPGRDRSLARTFTAAALDRRAENRLALAGELGLLLGPTTLVVGVVARLVEQKGLDLLLETTPELLARDAALVVLGSGEPWLEHALAELAALHPDRVAVRLAFDPTLARRIYAGCDVFAMPSRFEPCGLGQLLAMRYGAVPLVRRTGGLADTVTPASGFLFDEPAPEALLAAFDEVRVAFADRQRWQGLQRAGMQRDSSWAESARRYAEVFAGA